MTMLLSELGALAACFYLGAAAGTALAFWLQRPKWDCGALMVSCATLGAACGVAIGVWLFQKG